MNYLYAPESFSQRDKTYRDLYEMIGNENRLAMFMDIEGLSARLRNFNNPEIVTLLGVRSADLPNIIAIKELFLNAALIILLSDEDQETFETALGLKPKFLGLMNDDLDKILPIVKKLLLKNRQYDFR